MQRGVDNRTFFRVRVPSLQFFPRPPPPAFCSLRSNEPPHLDTAPAWRDAQLRGNDAGESVGRATDAAVLQEVRRVVLLADLGEEGRGVLETGFERPAMLSAGLKKERGGKEKERKADAFAPFRLFKFPQMDFEMAIWEMTSLLIAPKKVFRSIYYHVPTAPILPSKELLANKKPLLETYAYLPLSTRAHTQTNTPHLPSPPSLLPPTNETHSTQKQKTHGTAPTPPSPTCSPSSCSSRAWRGG